jgi:hypothetical protein
MTKLGRAVVVVLSVAALSGIGLLTAGGAYGGDGNVGNLVVNKAVEGPEPEGTQYTIQFSCIIRDDPIPVINQVVITGAGNAVDADFLAFDGNLPATCTVSEPGTGGAARVTITCEETEGLATCDADDRVTFPNQAPPNFHQGTITVTNTFEEPAPVVIEAAPAFTG